MLVLLGVLFTIILAGLDNTIVSTVMPVALPELGGAHLYSVDICGLHARRCGIDADLGTGIRSLGTPSHVLHRHCRVHGRERALRRPLRPR